MLRGVALHTKPTAGRCPVLETQLRRFSGFSLTCRYAAYTSATEKSFFSDTCRFSTAAALRSGVFSLSRWIKSTASPGFKGSRYTWAKHRPGLTEMTTQVWNDILAVNLSAAFHTMRHALPRMAQAQYGCVINIASVHGLVASVSKAPYVSAKFGLVGLSKVAALEYAAVGSTQSGGVTVNCICPGWVDTAMVAPQIAERRSQLNVSTDEAIGAMLSEKQPTRRLSSPAEIARLAVWLCDPAAHNITGTAIPVDGGWTAQ
jgi:NAD(P)-dependent dehydrogenase (short-subunit alcohol dehydrogenase family)